LQILSQVLQTRLVPLPQRTLLRLSARIQLLALVCLRVQVLSLTLWLT
jgi:hypothetical protein